jgi:Squalene-hopene cyclase C-terminal domain
MVSDSSVQRAIARATDFLLRQQDRDGAWRDFRVRPGRSDAWVTAYVGAQLRTIAQRHPSSACTRAIAAAVGFIERARNADGGWGYNANCPPDADSTARALLFLHAAGAEVRLRDHADLTRFALRDGAFVTYRSADAWGSWCRGHPDVTVVALRALSRVLSPNHVLVRRGRARLHAYLRRRDAFASYWWATPFYLAREVALFFEASKQVLPIELPRTAVTPAAGYFERALACEVALLQRDNVTATRYAHQLVAAQRDDGSWLPSPILRIVDPRSRSIGDAYSKRSPIVTDDRAIFTASTVAGGLVRFETTPARLYTRGRVGEGHPRIAQPSPA